MDLTTKHLGETPADEREPERSGTARMTLAEWRVHPLRPRNRSAASKAADAAFVDAHERMECERLAHAEGGR